MAALPHESRSFLPESFEEIPGIALAASEPARAMVDVQALIMSAPALATAPRGDGHSVLVLPGLMASDSSTLILRNYLELLGYHVYGWHLGRNVGPTAAVVAELPAAVERIAKRSRRKITVIGWSLGGIYARNMAHKRPDDIRQVITLGSPFRMVDTRQSRASGVYQKYSHLHSTDGVETPSTRISALPTDMPSTSIYSRFDGVVPWQSCIEPQGDKAENIRVHASHIGLGFDPLTLWAIADRLAQPEDDWKPFRPILPLRMLYPRADDPARPRLYVAH